MFSVNPDLFQSLLTGSRWLFAFIALLLLFFAFSWLRAERKERRDKIKRLPGAGTVGELIVINGSDELSRDTWFPVPREGVLGSLRSCDLVVPCPGVCSRHLDFAWKDGVGLLIRPRSGCEALVDGVPVNARTAGESAALIHGSFLQVGSALLRLQLFSALDHTNRSFVSGPAPAEGTSVVPAVPPVPVNEYPQQFPLPDSPAAFLPEQPYPPAVPLPLQSAGEIPAPAPEAVSPPAGMPLPQETLPSGQRRRRADRWKEDWSE